MTNASFTIQQKYKAQGFTLMELLVAAGIAVTLAVIAWPYFGDIKSSVDKKSVHHTLVEAAIYWNTQQMVLTSQANGTKPKTADICQSVNKFMQPQLQALKLEQAIICEDGQDGYILSLNDQGTQWSLDEYGRYTVDE